MKNLILGAGVSGLGASYSLREKGEDSIILEKNNDFGGLCGNFQINGFLFDKFVHLSFTKDEKVLEIFNDSTREVLEHIPNPFNLYKRQWIKHPAQNNLYPLEGWEKNKIIQDFLNRPSVNMDTISDYEQWLRVQFGDYFAENFPMVYTKKYWMHEAKDLEIKWIGNRIYQPSVKEVIMGAKTSDTPVTYYAKKMKYPKSGGFKAFFRSLAEKADIRYGKNVVLIDTIKKVILTEDGESFAYDNLYSTLPLPEYLNLIGMPKLPENVAHAMKRLNYTSGYSISIGLKSKDIPPYLWWYIYDEDILAARVYSPSLKSSQNAPVGCSSLQMEVYCKKDAYTTEELFSRTIDKIIDANIIKKKDILFKHITFEKYANIVFDKGIYENRKIVRDYLSSIGIATCGRFGEWKYLWSDQSLLSGINLIK